MTTEESALEVYISRLISEYHYPEVDIQREVPYAFGKARYRFDILVMKRGKPYILIEVKTLTRNPQSSIDQLRRYVRALTVDFAVVTDGHNDICYKVDRDTYKTRLTSIPDIPSHGKTLASIGKHSNKELIQAEHGQLSNIIWKTVSQFRSHSGLTTKEAFKEILNLLILKAYDEESQEGMFRASFEEPPENVRSRIKVLLTKAKKEYPMILKDTLELSDELLRDMVYSFQKYSVKDSTEETEGTKLPIDKVLGPRAHYTHSTPRNLVKLMIDLLAPKKGSTFIDPACGVGGLLTEAASRGLEVIGIEMVVDIAQYAKANLALSGLKGQVITAESLGISENREIESLKSKFDYAAVVPPFGGKVADERLNRFLLGSHKRIQRTDILFLEHTIRFLREGGRMTIVIPDGLLFGDSYHDVREFLLKQCIVEAIITLPAGLLLPLSSIKTALLILEKSSRKGTKCEDQVYVANIEDTKDFEKIVSTYRDFENKKIIPKEDHIFITNLKSPKQINYDYLKGLQKLKTQNKTGLSPEWPQVQLQNIARITTGIRKKNVGEKNGKDEAFYIRAGDVNDLLLDLAESDRINTSGDVSRYTAESGDILMTRAGTVGRVAIVEDDSVPIILGSNVLKISINKKTQVLPEFLLAVLRSKHGQTQIEMFTGGSTIRAISVSGVRQIMIPIPTKAEQEKVTSQIKKIIESKKEAIKISNELKMKEERMLNELNEMIGGT